MKLSFSTLRYARWYYVYTDSDIYNMWLCTAFIFKEKSKARDILAIRQP